jgi:hypothetical protein
VVQLQTLLSIWWLLVVAARRATVAAAAVVVGLLRTLTGKVLVLH